MVAIMMLAMGFFMMPMMCDMGISKMFRIFRFSKCGSMGFTALSIMVMFLTIMIMCMFNTSGMRFHSGQAPVLMCQRAC